MWRVKTFKTFEEQQDWTQRNRHRYQIVRIFVNNGYAVEYRRLRIIG